jgi:DNA mismatch repair protein MutL
VRNLFFNTPARRKFLKSVPTEQERCVDVMRAVALAHPAIGFKVVCDGRVNFEVPADQSPKQRVLSMLGKELGPQMLEAAADQFDDARGITLWGMVGLPAIARGTNKSQFIFINGRPVRDRTIQHAVLEAYRGLIEPGRFPTIVLMIDMSPAGVDVNVHPAKAEVRFRDSGLVHSVVYHAIKRTLQAADLTPSITLNTTSHVVDRNFSQLPGSGLAPPPPMNPAQVASFIERSEGSMTQGPRPGFDIEKVRDSLASVTLPETPAHPITIPTIVPAAKILQIHKSYIVTQDDQGIVIIDQHALHERVMFEYLLERVMRGPLQSQRLLNPAVVPASARQIELLPELQELFARLGIEAEPIGPFSLGVRSFPTFLFERRVDPIDFLVAIFEKAENAQFISNLKSGGEEAMRDVLDMMSCKAAVKAGDRMTDIELAELLALRESVERSSNCPHGRPTSVRITIRDLEKLFHRA